jgi:hypothetical protein
MRMPPFKRRTAALWIVPALAAGAGGATFAASSSSAEDPAAVPSAALRIAATTDPAFASSSATDARAAARLATAAGVPAAMGQAPRTWSVGGRTVIGYVSAGGSFCFAFAGGAGGCLQPGTLSDELPLDITTDYGPGVFNLYGLALDGVVAVTVQLGGRSQPAAFAHNAFSFSDARLGGTAAIKGEAIATMSDGTTRSVPFGVEAMESEPVRLP